MDYRRHRPSAELDGLVEHYWSIVSPAPPGPLRAVLVPSGRATIQFCLGRPGRRYESGRPARTNADVYLPVSTEPIVIEQEGPSHYVGIQFTPWGARALFPDAPAHPEQVETAVGPLPDPAALATDPTPELDRWLGTHLPGTLPTGVDLLKAAVDVVDADPSAGEVADLADRLHAAPSTLYRAFRRGVGLSPKQYVQIMRYRAFTDALIAEAGGAPTALLAGLAGYADQAHAARDFSRFTGMTASRFRDTHDGIAALMARTD